MRSRPHAGAQRHATQSAARRARSPRRSPRLRARSPRTTRARPASAPGARGARAAAAARRAAAAPAAPGTRVRPFASQRRSILAVRASNMARILFAHGHLLSFDRKQHAIGKPYPPLATITAAAHLRALGHDVALYDPMLDDDTRGFARALSRARADVVVLYDDVFNWFTKMCLGRMRAAALAMIAAARAAGARVVVSGHDAADAPEVYLDAGADYVIVGEAEVTLARAGGRARCAGRRARRGQRGRHRRAGVPRSRPDAPHRSARAAEGSGRAADGGVGSRRRRALPRVLARAPRVLRAERRDDARLPVQVQLVREAGLRQHVPHALAGQRDRGAARCCATATRPIACGSATTSSGSRRAGCCRSPPRSPPRGWRCRSCARRAPI